MNKPETISVLIEGIDEYKKIGDSKPRTSMTVNVILSENGFPLENPRLIALYTAAACRRTQETIELIEREMPELIDKIIYAAGRGEETIEISSDSAENIAIILRDALLILKDGKM